MVNCKLTCLVIYLFTVLVKSQSTQNIALTSVLFNVGHIQVKFRLLSRSAVVTRLMLSEVYQFKWVITELISKLFNIICKKNTKKIDTCKDNHLQWYLSKPEVVHKSEKSISLLAKISVLFHHPNTTVICSLVNRENGIHIQLYVVICT